MKRKTFFAMMMAICLIACSFAGAPAPAPTEGAAPQALGTITAHAAPTLAQSALTAKAAILIDADTGRVLFEKNADERRAPASTTKIMTLLIACEHGGLDRLVTVPASAGRAPADSTRVPVYEGEKMPLKDLLYGLMIKSGNDAANAIGTLVSGSVENFVGEMNAKAKRLGLTNTHFVNAHGYPASGHYMSARDLAKLTRTALEHPTARKIATTNRYTMRATDRRGELKITKSYAILDPDSPYHDARAFGVKTGYAQSSGQCFVGAAEKNGKTLISVVLNSALTKPEKWIDTKKMFDYGFGVLGA